MEVLAVPGIWSRGHYMKGHYFSWPRFAAMVMKEFIQMRRDRLTFAMMVGLPLIQIILFGFAINEIGRAHV